MLTKVEIMEKKNEWHTYHIVQKSSSGNYNGTKLENFTSSVHVENIFLYIQLCRLNFLSSPSHKITQPQCTPHRLVKMMLHLLKMFY